MLLWHNTAHGIFSTHLLSLSPQLFLLSLEIKKPHFKKIRQLQFNLPSANDSTNNNYETLKKYKIQKVQPGFSVVGQGSRLFIWYSRLTRVNPLSWMLRRCGVPPLLCSCLWQCERGATWTPYYQAECEKCFQQRTASHHKPGLASKVKFWLFSPLGII